MRDLPSAEPPLAIFTYGVDGECRITGTRKLQGPEQMSWEVAERERDVFQTLAEMQTIQEQYRQQDRDPTDIELETIAQTWSEHCSHKTLAGRIRYRVATPGTAAIQSAYAWSDLGEASGTIHEWQTAAGSR